MARHVLIALALALFASGCLRQNFDLCAEPRPDPECALVDAGGQRDAATDAAAGDAGSTDAGSTDAGSTDAGSNDAGSND